MRNSGDMASQAAAAGDQGERTKAKGSRSKLQAHGNRYYIYHRHNGVDDFICYCNTVSFAGLRSLCFAFGPYLTADERILHTR